MKRNIIKAKSGGVIITGKSKGNITTNVTDKLETPNGSQEVKSNNRIVILTAIITAIGTIISGILIASSNWFTK